LYLKAITQQLDGMEPMEWLIIVLLQQELMFIKSALKNQETMKELKLLGV